MERKCPNNGAPMTADVKRGLWVCQQDACYKAFEASNMPLPQGCKGLDREYQEPMSPAEVMTATGAERLL